MKVKVLTRIASKWAKVGWTLDLKKNDPELRLKRKTVFVQSQFQSKALEVTYGNLTLSQINIGPAGRRPTWDR